MSSIFSFFRRGLEKTATKIGRTISGMFTGVKAWDASNFEDLEMLLISADFGVSAATRIVTDLRDRYERGKIATSEDIRKAAAEDVRDILSAHQREIHLDRKSVV